eukprot:COSAG04_NODE_370_length_15729_cov_5.743506_4_plen_83_part_00
MTAQPHFDWRTEWKEALLHHHGVSRIWAFTSFHEEPAMAKGPHFLQYLDGNVLPFNWLLSQPGAPHRAHILTFWALLSDSLT